MAPTRDQAWQTLTKYTKSESLLRHALAVEASTAAYARQLDGDEELWRVVALLHDFDYEMHPTLDKHPQDGAPILREEGYPEEVIEGVLSHAEHLGLPRDTPLKKVLFACDELGWVPLRMERHERGVIRRRHDLEPIREQLATARGHLGGVRVAPLRSCGERGVEPEQDRCREPTRIEARRTLLRDEGAGRLI